ncbi:MAG: zinc-finger domain-containing protein [Gammaproteobacteria bacterium]|nr:zinc-finger domain-containing protein [Gammaproteobacteria bacterium]
METKACTRKHKTVTRRDLPLSCPMPDERLWDGHPRVYLDIEKMGHVTCPYCETEYQLIVEPQA